MPRGRNTREEIIAVAMRLFVDQGYDKTSLREIAEELEVTKAALYYHFRTKEEIVRAALAEHTERVDAVLDWLQHAPEGPDRDRELVDRWQELFAGESGTAMRFTQVNPTVLSREEFGESYLAQIRRLVSLIAAGHGGAEPDLRAVLAIGAMVVGVMGAESAVMLSGSPAQQREASRRVALELLAGIRSGAGAPSAT